VVGLTIGRFAGIPPEAFRFYEELSSEGNNDRAWFDANRRVYERSVRLPLLARLRAAVDDGRRGGALVRAVALMRERGLRVRGQELVRAPRGFSTDHPRIELLRHPWLTVERSWSVEAWMHSEEAYERITGVWRDAAPVTSWLRRHVGAPVEPVGRR
jgi:uncharacterized protein (DUF2461 family)